MGMETRGQLRFLLLQVVDPHYHQEWALKDMQEAEQLVETFGGIICEKAIQHRIHPHSSTYVGPGKVAWLKEVVKEKKIDVVVLNSLVKSSQIFRLEKELWDVNTRIQVWDRVDLILHIFELHASTTEAKLQIEMARITHIGPRVYGLGKTLLSRQGGGIGTRGLGETNIERERRVIRNRRQHIKKQLEKLAGQKQRRLQFRKEQGIGPVALVGYTSAGKTSLFNVLTGKEKVTQSGLFTTLDTVVGKLKIADSPMPILISDTIGFIRDLPPTLIDAFRSTLMESLEAKVLLHVIDSSDVNMAKKMDAVEDILRDLDVTQPVILVFNKIDCLSLSQQEALRFSYSLRPHVLVSAKTGHGLDELKEKMATLLLASY